jgi:ferrous iron transport protein B
LGVPVVSINPAKGKGITALQKAIEQTAHNLYKVPARDFIDNKALATELRSGKTASSRK